jgi:hypothetical protein
MGAERRGVRAARGRTATERRGTAARTQPAEALQSNAAGLRQRCCAPRVLCARSSAIEGGSAAMRAARRATGGAGGGTHARGAANAPARAQRRARRRQAEAARALHGGLHHGCARAVQKRAGPPARAGPPNRAACATAGRAADVAAHQTASALRKPLPPARARGPRRVAARRSARGVSSAHTPLLLRGRGAPVHVVMFECRCGFTAGTAGTRPAPASARADGTKRP